jgi:hypothetical protein
MKEKGIGMTGLEELIRELPHELYYKAEDYVGFLIDGLARKPKGDLKLD